jgi:hypothetical protein
MAGFGFRKFKWVVALADHSVGSPAAIRRGSSTNIHHNSEAVAKTTGIHMMNSSITSVRRERRPLIYLETRSIVSPMATGMTTHPPKRIDKVSNSLKNTRKLAGLRFRSITEEL